MAFSIQALLSCTFFSNKHSPAPVFYCILQIILVLSVVSICPYFIRFQADAIISLFWLITAITVFLYFKTHLMDPGYVPNDVVFFTEQEESQNVQSLGVSKKIDIMTRFQAPFSFPSMNDNFSPMTRLEPFSSKGHVSPASMPRKFFPQSSGRSNETNTQMHTCDAKLSTRDKVSSAITGYTGQTQYPALEKDFQFQKLLKQVSNEEVSPETNTNVVITPIMMDEPVILDDDQAQKEDEAVVECEPSLDEIDRPSEGANSLRFEAKIKTIVEGKLNEEESEKEAQASSKCAEYISVENLNEKIVSDRKVQTEGGISALSLINIEKTEGIFQKEKIYQDVNEHRSISITHLGGSTPDTKAHIDDDKNLLKQAFGSARKGYQPFADDDDEKETKRNTLPTRPSMMKMLKVPVYDQKLSSPSPSEPDSPKQNMSTKKDIAVSLDVSRAVMIIKKKVDDETVVESQNSKDKELLYVERRYCTACNLEQPFRSKHCRDCQKCVAQYDHHCPWLGTCVGEKNHFTFYLFLIFQMIQIVWGETKLIDNMFKKHYEDWFSQNWPKLMVFTIITFFLIMVTLLLLFHTYLAFKNLTTWETLSWDKISYLKEWQVEWGSPFSQGIFNNLKFFCCSNKRHLRKWRLPKYKKRSTKQVSSV